MLDEADFQLGDIMDRMKRLDVYEPIMHFGWTQATWPDEQTEAIPLQRLAPPPAGLDGALTLYLSRYLHLVVDLQLEASDVMVIQQDEVEQLGDVAAHRLGELARGLGNWGREARSTMGANIREYLQEESRDVPSRYEVDRFSSDVSILRDDVARIEARLNRLQASN